MTPEEKAFQDIIDKYLIVLNAQLSPIEERIKRNIDRVLAGGLSDAEIEKLKFETLKEYDNINAVYTIFASQTIPLSYRFGFTYSAQTTGTDARFTGIDDRTVNILIRDTISQYTNVVNSSKSYITTFFEFSKQGQITESVISDLVAKGLLDKGTGRASRTLIRQALKEKLDAEFVDKVTKDTRLFRQIKTAEINARNVSDAVKKRALEKFEEKFNDRKYFQLIDKNGKVRNYKITSYSELVSRTRMGDSQVEGILAEGEQNGDQFYWVTVHNTTTPICKKFEGKILTTIPGLKNPKFIYLTGETKPTYHPNCQHRIKSIYVPVSERY